MNFVKGLLNVQKLSSPKLLIGLGIYLLVKTYFSGGKCKITKDLKSKTIVITGCNTGIGAETAKELARMGANIILANRSLQRSQYLLDFLKQRYPKQTFEFIELQLDDLQSVKKFSENFKKQYDKLDILINNAGIMALPQRQLSKQGIELQFATNHIGHFYLTHLLMESLQKVEQSRVINISSRAHEQSFFKNGKTIIHFDDINFERSYNKFMAYGQSKLANVMFSKQLQSTFEKKKIQMKSASLHPGGVRTELASCFMGAQTSLYCALVEFDKLQGGAYYSDCAVKINNPEADNIENQLVAFDPKALTTSMLCLFGYLYIRKYFNGAKCKLHKDLTGKVVIVTGCNTGIGEITAKELAKMGATIVLANRSLQRSQQVLEYLQKNFPKQNCQFIELQLDDLQSVKQFSEKFQSQFNRLDILVNNAGICALPERQVSKQGMELQLATNFLGHFYLTHLLLEQLKNAQPARVINVSSGGHDKILYHKGQIHFDDINLENNYFPNLAYAQSKLANVLFAKEFQTRADQTNLKLKSVSLHPGLARTELGRYGFSGFAMKLGFLLMFPIFYTVSKSQFMGAQTSLQCCLDDYEQLIGGEYYADCKVAKSSENSHNKQDALKLCQEAIKFIEKVNCQDAQKIRQFYE